ncbi:MAG: bifunctional diaminohydroxyphosphoribosylaminopyrimidine deaminase/5-amino-6-(5-phosphoribosylamino)uracil reductase RibD [Eudoraea sp.]|nr:bifunctional diaminohydroxyphosphoribosylaminopyrimidine deaminase/5-amino-6-(5-phosphoribosylamino)uracil reductase RibD [Eudoraea sp.]
MMRCLQLAKLGLGTAAPNPAVGCVIVHNKLIVGEGFTSPYGGPHAEVNAISSVKDKSILSGAILYVTLEPCSHFGKTPPCTNLILKNNIPEVVIGTADPHHKVAGEGIEKLRQAGCKVTVGILETACRKHHKRFLKFQEEKRPYIILKWAQSVDGFIAPADSERNEDARPYWITNKRSRQLVHKWRSEEQAILVGTGTVLKDNPGLTTRTWFGKSPLRIVLDSKLSITANYQVLDQKVKTILFTEKEISGRENDSLVYEKIDFSGDIVAQICAVLYRYNIISLIIEGGARTIETFISSGLWDEARIFTGNSRLINGLSAPMISGSIAQEFNILDDKVKVLLNA